MKKNNKAKVIYQTNFLKESAQKERNIDDNAIPRPFDLYKGDLIEYYMQLLQYNSYHARSIRLKTDCTVNIGVNLHGIDKEKAEERLSSVNEQGQSFQEVISKVWMDYETTGNAYVEVVKNAGNQVVEIYHCPSIFINKVMKDNQISFRYDAGTEPVFFPRYKAGDHEFNSILHIANFVPDNRYYGLPDWRGCISDIELTYYATEYNKRFFSNSCIPEMAIVVEGGELDDETCKAITEYFQSNFQGVDNAFKTLYIPLDDDQAKIRFEKLAMETNKKDGAFTQLLNQCRDNIIAAHGVFPRLIGIMSAGQLGGGGEVAGQLKIFQELTIAPRQAFAEMKLNPIIKEMGFKNGFAFQTMNTTVQEADSTYYPNMINAGILTADEAREKLGHPPMKEQDIKPELKLIQNLEEIKKSL